MTEEPGSKVVREKTQSPGKAPLPATTTNRSPNRLQRVYSSGRSLFQIASKSTPQLINNCVVVLDTNCLLRPYSATSSSLDEIDRVLTKLGANDRLRITEHSAREFFSNRTNAVKKILQKIDGLRSKQKPDALDSIPLISNSDEFKALRVAEAELHKAHDGYRDALNRVVKKVSGWGLDDPVVSLYRRLFNESAVIGLSVEDDQLEREFQRRLECRIPPGFRDEGKGDNSEGDIIIWLSILEFAEAAKSNVLLVSDDLKDDWWERAGDKRLSPRFELVEEFHRRTQGLSFGMLTFPQFLESFGASENAVNEAKEVDKVRAWKLRRRTGKSRPGSAERASRDASALLIPFRRDARLASRIRRELMEDPSRSMISDLVCALIPVTMCENDRRVRRQIIDIFTSAILSEELESELEVVELTLRNHLMQLHRHEERPEPVGIGETWTGSDADKSDNEIRHMMTTSSKSIEQQIGIFDDHASDVFDP